MRTDNVHIEFDPVADSTPNTPDQMQRTSSRFGTIKEKVSKVIKGVMPVSDPKLPVVPASLSTQDMLLLMRRQTDVLIKYASDQIRHFNRWEMILGKSLIISLVIGLVLDILPAFISALQVNQYNIATITFSLIAFCVDVFRDMRAYPERASKFHQAIKDLHSTRDSLNRSIIDLKYEAVSYIKRMTEKLAYIQTILEIDDLTLQAIYVDDAPEPSKPGV